MSSAEALQAMLAPLGVYRWEDSFQWAELRSEGKALDACIEELEGTQREMHLLTAQGEGLKRLCEILASPPISQTQEQLRAALAALLRIGDGSFTIDAVSDNISGCGIPAQVRETETAGKVEISFPGTPGIPDDFPRLQPIIEDMIPCHLELSYLFWYITWARVEEKLPTWKTFDAHAFTWKSFERFVWD